MPQNTNPTLLLIIKAGENSLDKQRKEILKTEDGVNKWIEEKKKEREQLKVKIHNATIAYNEIAFNPKTTRQEKQEKREFLDNLYKELNKMEEIEKLTKYTHSSVSSWRRKQRGRVEVENDPFIKSNFEREKELKKLT